MQQVNTPPQLGHRVSPGVGIVRVENSVQWRVPPNALIVLRLSLDYEAKLAFSAPQESSNSEMVQACVRSVHLESLRRPQLLTPRAGSALQMQRCQACDFTGRSTKPANPSVGPVRRIV